MQVPRYASEANAAAKQKQQQRVSDSGSACAATQKWQRGAERPEMCDGCVTGQGLATDSPLSGDYNRISPRQAAELWLEMFYRDPGAPLDHGEMGT
eukprot:366448-Chlamydomonas_euryale.AAC.4